MFQNLGLEEAGVKMTKNGAIEVCFSFFNPLIILSTFGSFCRLRAVRMEEKKNFCGKTGCFLILMWNLREKD